MVVSEVINKVLDPAGEPRDGVTVLGGEPFLQLDGLLALMKALKQRGQHVTVYSGHTLEELTSRRDPRITEILRLTDILIALLPNSPTVSRSPKGHDSSCFEALFCLFQSFQNGLAVFSANRIEQLIKPIAIWRQPLSLADKVSCPIEDPLHLELCGLA